LKWKIDNPVAQDADIGLNGASIFHLVNKGKTCNGSAWMLDQMQICLYDQNNRRRACSYFRNNEGVKDYIHTDNLPAGAYTLKVERAWKRYNTKMNFVVETIGKKQALSIN